MLRNKVRSIVPVARQRLFEAAASRRDPEGMNLVRRVRQERLTFLEPRALLDLRQRVREVEERGLAGSIVEAGCALGGSAIVLAASKAPSRTLSVHDVFGMIPPPSDRDGDDVKARYAEIASGKAEGFGGDVYYGYQADLRDTVAASFARFGYPPEASNILLVEGLFEDTIRPDGPVALGHIDGDWYESVKVCLERLWPALVPGGVLVIDDYEGWSGCRTAVDEFVARSTDVQREQRARLHLVKSAAA